MKNIFEGMFYGVLLLIFVFLMIAGGYKFSQFVFADKLSLVYICENKSEIMAKFILECIKTDNSLNQCKNVAANLYCKEEQK